MAAKRVTLEIYQGDDYFGKTTVANGTPTPPNLTGYVARAQVRASFADKAPEVVVEIITWIEGNIIRLNIPRAQTKTMSGSYLWDLQLTRPDATVTTILWGPVVVQNEITREVV